MCRDAESGEDAADQNGEGSERPGWFRLANLGAYDSLQSPSDLEGEWTLVPTTDATSAEIKKFVRCRVTYDTTAGSAPNRGKSQQ